MSEEEITSWQVLREDGANCAWINGRYVGTITDGQVKYLQRVCPTPRAPDSLTAGEISQPEIVVVENALPAVSGLRKPLGGRSARKGYEKNEYPIHTDA